MSFCSTPMFDSEDGTLVGFARGGSNGAVTFYGVDNSNLGSSLPSGWTTYHCIVPCDDDGPTTPPPTVGAWWLPIPLGGSVNEDTGAAVFPGGPRVAMSASAGNMTVTTNGTVISGLNITGKIIVNAENVTIRDTQCYGIQVNSSLPDGTGPLIEYCRIRPPDCWNTSSGALEAAIVYNNYTVRWTDISNTFDGLKAFGNVSVDNCWIHDMSPCSNAGNTGGGYAHSDGIQTGGGSGLTVSNSAFTNTGNNAGIFLFRDGAGGYGTNPISNVSITNCTITQSGNFNLWIEEANDPGIPGGDKVPLNVTVNNVYLGCANPVSYLYPSGSGASPTWRGKLRLYFATSVWPSGTSTWGNVYSLNGTSTPPVIPYVTTHTGANWCHIDIDP